MIKRFITFKGIHLSADNAYFLCDFYRQQKEQDQVEYEIIVETIKRDISKHQFVFHETLQKWVCNNPDDLPTELIEKIIGQILALNES